MAAAAAELQRVVDVEIDDGGVFKYVLLRVRPRAAGASEPGKEVVRGHGWAEYHGEGRAGPGGGTAVAAGARFLQSGSGGPFGSALPGSAPLPSRTTGAPGRRGTGLRGLRRAHSLRRSQRRPGAA